MELTQQQQEAFHRAAALCSRAEKCSNDILKKLINWGISEGEADHVLSCLTEEKYVDDARFARSYVRDKFRFNKWGKVKIAYQLRARQIDPGTIDTALEEIDEDAYKNVLIELLSEKNKSLKAANPFERRAKLIRFAQSRGFEMDLIYPALDEVLN